MTSDTRSSSRSVLYVAGEVDYATGPELRQQLQHLSGHLSQHLVVDLSSVTFIDCAGLRPLLETQARIGHRMQLRLLPRPVTRLLYLTDLDSTFRVVGTNDE